VVKLQRTAADRLGVKGGHEHQAGWGRELLVCRGDAAIRVEARLEPLGELGEVLLQAISGVGVSRIVRRDLNHGRREEPFDVGHGGNQPIPLPIGKRFEDRPREPIGALIEHRSLGQTGICESRPANPSVGDARTDPDEPIALQCPQQPAQIAGIKVEP